MDIYILNFLIIKAALNKQRYDDYIEIPYTNGFNQILESNLYTKKDKNETFVFVKPYNKNTKTILYNYKNLVLFEDASDVNSYHNKIFINLSQIKKNPRYVHFIQIKITDKKNNEKCLRTRLFAYDKNENRWLFFNHPESLKEPKFNLDDFLNAVVILVLFFILLIIIYKCMIKYFINI